MPASTSVPPVYVCDSAETNVPAPFFVTFKLPESAIAVFRDVPPAMSITTSPPATDDVTVNAFSPNIMPAGSFSELPFASITMPSSNWKSIPDVRSTAPVPSGMAKAVITNIDGDTPFAFNAVYSA